MHTFNLSSQLMIEQSTDGYRYSIEPFLLVHFSKLLTGTRLLDVGAGCGIIPLLVAMQTSIKEIVGIEIQKSLYDIAVNNISRNDSSDRIRLIHGNFINAGLISTLNLFDTIISNPPYRKLNTGRINPNHEKAIARHEISIDLNSLLSKTSSLLKYKGKFIMAYPPLRLREVQERLYFYKLFPSRLRFIHSSSEADSRIFLIEAVKNQQVECIIEPPLFVYNKDGSFSKEMEKIYASFNYFSRSHHIKKK